MNADSQVVKTEELILARLQDMDFSQWVLLAPAAFAFVVVFLVIFYRQQETLTGLLKSIFIPPVIINTLGLIWAVWLLIFTIGGIAMAMTVKDVNLDLYVIGLIPLVAYPLLLGVLATIVICVKHPSAFVPLLAVAMISTVYLIFAWLFRPQFGWWVVLVPVLFVALVYVAMMYRQDSQSVHPLWATFLGLLRCGVYAILAFCFLMPGCQSYDTRITDSKVLVLIDVSGSMSRIDHLPKADQDPDKLPKRIDDVVNEIVSSDVLTGITKVSPVTLCVFGARLDDYQLIELKMNEQLTADKLKEFITANRTKVEAPAVVKGKELEKDEREKLQVKLNNLYDGFTAGTNVTGSALQALLREIGTNVQAIVVFSDGASNLSSSDSLQELLQRANNPKKTTHIMTVCVGNYIEPKSIRIEDIQAPVRARPDDKFFVQVPVYGDGLAGEDFEVTLEMELVEKKGDKWEPKPGALKPPEPLKAKGKFKAEGKHAFDKVKFEIDIRKLNKIDSKDDTQDPRIMGYWQFTAKVPRNEKEHFAKGEHVSKPAHTLVEKKKMRVLLFSGGPSREYQFLRTVLYREVKENRMELSVYLQTGKEQDNVDQDVDQERLLDRFPTSLARDPMPTDKSKYYDMTSYDVIVAIDPDWSELSNKQIEDLNKWVSETWAGGFIFTAGPIYTYQLARDEKSVGKNLTPIKELLPVTLKDSRLAGFGIELDPTRPYLLKFDQRAAKFDFMKLDETNKSTTPNWDEFFWEGEKPSGNKPYNGFFGYYPVEKINKGGLVLATFDRPVGNPLVPDVALKEPPFIATQQVGKGHTIYLGSNEFWRLRSVDEEFHKRFWIQAIRHAGSGGLNLTDDHGLILMAQKAPVGTVSLEAQLLKGTKAPLPPDPAPQVKVTLLESSESKDTKGEQKPFDLKPRPDGIWTGWFQGEFVTQKPGRYRLSIAIPGTNKELEHIITVYRPDPEKDNARPNHDHLFEMATNALPVFKQVDKEKAQAFKDAVQKNDLISDEIKQKYLSDGKDPDRLCFKLENTDLIPYGLIRVPPTEESLKGGLTFLMDKGYNPGWTLRGDHMTMIVAGGIGALILLILLATQRWVFAAVVAALTAVVVGGVFMMNLVAEPAWELFPISFSFVLFGLAALLCVEWLTRKLLRLA